MNTIQEIIEFRWENASDAVDLVLELLTTCVTHPKPALVDWVTHVAPLVTQLMDQREDHERERAGWVYTSVEAFSELAARIAQPSE